MKIFHVKQDFHGILHASGFFMNGQLVGNSGETHVVDRANELLVLRHNLLYGRGWGCGGQINVE
jgi:hypothetical protein